MKTAPAPAIHVVAAILRDARGRILLTRRTDGRDLAGLWEFPGGKVEAGESVELALRRELHEELGIRIGDCDALIAVPHAYPSKRILLDVHQVATFTGRARGREGQALAWVPVEKLSTYPMPAADRPVVAALRQPDRYLVTPEPGDDDAAFLHTLDAALAAGVRRVQLRAKSVDSGRLRALAIRARDATNAHGAELLLNSACARGSELAPELGVGLHLTHAHLLESRVRPDVALLAASCHDAASVRQADALGCDFAVLGPVRPTASHTVAATLGWDGFAALREATAIPIYALGGLAPADLAEARANGAQGIAAIRGLWPRAE
jgi:8-oxo-dGTP diphosphatase